MAALRSGVSEYMVKIARLDASERQAELLPRVYASAARKQNVPRIRSVAARCILLDLKREGSDNLRRVCLYWFLTCITAAVACGLVRPGSLGARETAATWSRLTAASGQPAPLWWP